MLEENNFVRCLMIDFTKAFDTVDHDDVVLMSKLVGCNVSQIKLNQIKQKWFILFCSTSAGLFTFNH